MHVSRFGAARLMLAGALVSLGLIMWSPAPVAAQTLSYDVADQSIVRLQVRESNVTVRTWDRPSVQVEWPDGDPFVSFRRSLPWTSPSFPIPAAQNIKESEGPSGPVFASFPPEDFPVPDLTLGLHDMVRVNEVAPPGDLATGSPTDTTHLTVMIPASTKLLFIQQGRGDLTVSDYHGTSIMFSRGTRMVLSNMSGSAFVQNMYGHVYALNSSFDRIRLRTNRADQVFEQCHIRQIEAQSLTGNIVYDNGSFEPGLARFESDRGNIALGVTGNAQIGTHTQDGKIYSMIGRNPLSVAAAGSDQNFTFGGGGTLVNATSAHGNVYAYDGSIAERAPRTIPGEWRPVYQTVWSKRRQLPGNLAYPRSQQNFPRAERTPRTDRRPHARDVPKKRKPFAKARISAVRRRPT